MTPLDLSLFLAWMLDHGFNRPIIATEFPDFYIWYQSENPHLPTLTPRIVQLALSNSPRVEKLRVREGSARTIKYRVMPEAAALRKVA